MASFLYNAAPLGVLLSTLLSDVRSILARPATSSGVEKTGASTYRLVRKTDLGSTLAAEFDTSQACPFIRLEIFLRGEDTPAFSIDRVAVNGELPADTFTFPSMERLSQTLPVVDCPCDEQGKGCVALATSMAALARLCARVPAARGLFESVGPPPPYPPPQRVPSDRAASSARIPSAPESADSRSPYPPPRAFPSVCEPLALDFEGVDWEEVKVNDEQDLHATEGTLPPIDVRRKCGLPSGAGGHIPAREEELTSGPAVP